LLHTTDPEGYCWPASTLSSRRRENEQDLVDQALAALVLPAAARAVQSLPLSILSAMPQGSYYPPISDEEKERFLELIASGYSRPEAADALGQTGRRFRALCSEKSPYYDADFRRRFEKLTAKGGEYEANLRERLQAAAIERGLHSSDRLLEKLLVIHDPDWEAFKPSQFQGNVNIEKLAILLPGLSNETLDAVIRELESRPELKALPAA
jgi:hypothetical protein